MDRNLTLLQASIFIMEAYIRFWARNSGPLQELQVLNHLAISPALLSSFSNELKISKPLHAK